MKLDNITYLGFDYGSTNIAVGQIEVVPDEVWINSAFTTLDSRAEPDQMHKQVGRFLFEKVLRTYDCSILQPHYVFIEGLYKGPNANTFLKMARVAHSINVCMSSQMYEEEPEHTEVKVQYLNPAEWRKALFGKGNIKKEECQEWAYSEWPWLLDYKKSERGHRADALCIAKAGRLLTEEHEKEARSRGDGEEH